LVIIRFYILKNNLNFKVQKNKSHKTLFVEPAEFGHVLLHLAAFFSSDIWDKDSIHFLAPESVKTRVIQEKILLENDANVIFVEPLKSSKRFSKLYHFSQIVSLRKKNKYINICFKYLDYHIFLLPFFKLLFPKTKLSGIFFRPVLHYCKLNYPKTGVSKIYWYLMIVKNFVVFSYLKIGILSSCFFQDEGAINYFGGKKKNAFWIPTPLNNDYVIPPPEINLEQMNFLFFGEISKRKGIYRVLETWEKLPSKYKDKISLSIIGRTTKDELNNVTNLIGNLIKEGWVINFDNRFIENKEIPRIYEKAHVILSPHDLQFGTSGVTVQSAVWRRPIIVHNLGWVGFTVNNLNLGIAIDTSNISLFVETLSNIIERKVLLKVKEDILNDFVTKHDRRLWGKQLFFGITGMVK